MIKRGGGLFMCLAGVSPSETGLDRYPVCWAPAKLPKKRISSLFCRTSQFCKAKVAVCCDGGHGAKAPERKGPRDVLLLPLPSSPPPLEESSHRLGGGEHLGLMLRGFACAPVAGGVLGSKPGARAGVRVPRELHGPVLPRGAEALIQAP